MSETKLCPTCVEEGRKSQINIGQSSTTLMYAAPFYDEEGRYHLHDPNSTRTDYSCSNFHQWTETVPASRCACGWPDEEKPPSRLRKLFLSK